MSPIAWAISPAARPDSSAARPDSLELDVNCSDADDTEVAELPICPTTSLSLARVRL